MKRIVRSSRKLAIVGVLAWFGMQSHIIETTLNAATIAGTGTLSGMVKSPKEFKAAKVYAKNVDKNVTYMVFTQNGKYRAVDLLPGAYEVSVVKNGFAGGDAQKIAIKAGANASADFSLQEGPTRAAQGMRPDQPKDVPLLSYDALYPAGEGRELVERTCIRCHGPDFLPSKRWSAVQWNAAINLMESTTDARPGRMSPTSIPQGISPHERETLVAYLVKNFGPDSPMRGDGGPVMAGLF